MTRSRLLAAAGLFCLFAGGCSDPVVRMMTGPKIAECEGFDAPLSALAGPSRKELRARVVAPGIDHDFPFVIETRSNSLVIVGFTPLGTKAFTLVRRGESVEVENITGGPMVVPPRNIMEDVLAMSLPSRCAATAGPVAVSVAGGWQINDSCKAGRPTVRRIARPGARAEIEVSYASNWILVQQRRCRYNARYILQTSAPQRRR